MKLAETIKKEADIDTGAVGLITTGIQAEEILQNERADLILLARELLRDPTGQERLQKNSVLKLKHLNSMSAAGNRIT